MKVVEIIKTNDTYPICFVGSLDDESTFKVQCFYTKLDLLINEKAVKGISCIQSDFPNTVPLLEDVHMLFYVNGIQFPANTDLRSMKAHEKMLLSSVCETSPEDRLNSIYNAEKVISAAGGTISKGYITTIDVTAVDSKALLSVHVWAAVHYLIAMGGYSYRDDKNKLVSFKEFTNAIKKV